MPHPGALKRFASSWTTIEANVGRDAAVTCVEQIASHSVTSSVSGRLPSASLDGMCSAMEWNWKPTRLTTSKVELSQCQGRSPVSSSHNTTPKLQGRGEGGGVRWAGGRAGGRGGWGRTPNRRERIGAPRDEPTVS